MPKHADSVTGYIHPLYAHSFGEYGTPFELPRCGAWVLKRRIPGCSKYDGMGCYPLFACQDWSQLQLDLEQIRNDFVSLALVADPFGCDDPEYLQQCFQDLVLPFKDHFIVDLRCPLDTFVSEHHRRNARSALKKITVETCLEPTRFLNDWSDLYRCLISRHKINGINAFSRQVFQHQMRVPGLVAFRAEYEGASVGMLLWYVQDEVGYYHLGAYNQEGYALKASFGLFWHAIEYFAAKGLRWLNLGAGVGTRTTNNNGLSRFKRGWATGHRTAYFCGRIFDHVTYREITRTNGCSTTDYFPAYRQGEFT